MGTKTLNDMLNGELVILPEDIGPERNQVRNDKESLEIGFETGSSVVSRTVAGSRAEEAGVTDDDEILLQTQLLELLSNFELKMDMKVKRGEEVVDIPYWPRSREKVLCWEIRPV